MLFMGAYQKYRPKVMKILIFWAWMVFFSMASSCKNDIKKINELANEDKLADQFGKNIEVYYSDSTKLKLKFKAKILKHYPNSKEGPYYDFPKGVDVYFYDEKEKLESTITCGHAKHFENETLWEARDSVIVTNVQTNEELYTEHLFWDQEKKEIYSNVFTKITNQDGVFFGEEGFVSNQDFTKYRLKGSSGTVNIEDEGF